MVKPGPPRGQHSSGAAPGNGNHSIWERLRSGVPESSRAAPTGSCYLTPAIFPAGCSVNTGGERSPARLREDQDNRLQSDWICQLGWRRSLRVTRNIGGLDLQEELSLLRPGGGGDQAVLSKERWMQTGRTETIERFGNCFPNAALEYGTSVGRMRERGHVSLWPGVEAYWEGAPVNSLSHLPSLCGGCFICGSCLWDPACSRKAQRAWIYLRQGSAARPLPSLPSCRSLGPGSQCRMGDNPVIAGPSFCVAIRPVSICGCQ